MGTGTRLDFQFGPGKGELSKKRRAESDPLRVLVVSDLRGAARAPLDAQKALATSRIVGVDIDTFDSLFAALAPELELEVPGWAEALRLSFRTLGDLHPDHLYDTSPVIAALRRTRERLLDSKTFDAEKARLLAASGAPSATPPVQAAASESEGSTLERLLGKRSASDSAAPEAAVAANSASAIDQLLQRIVAPHVTHTPGPEQTRLVGSVDAAITAELRRILHAPAFQRLEAAWRGLAWLVHSNPVGEEMQISVLDASRAELEADLRACAGDLARSQLYQLVVQREVQGPGGKPIALIVGDFPIEGSEADISLLAGLGAVAAQAGGAFLGGADPRLVGANDLVREPNRGSWGEPDAAAAQRMALLRESAVAPFIGLAMPRVLGRVPYGKRSDPIERLDFTELSIGPAHADFLWINPAFACVQMIGAAFAEASWKLSLSGEHALSDLPLAMYHDGFDPQLKPCAEVALDYHSAEYMLDQGYMSLISHRSEASLRLPRFQSIAKPLAPLAGPWR